MDINKPLYYECHITVEPVFDERLEKFKELCAPFNFKVAKLLMEKGPSTKDSFCTGHSKDPKDIMKRMFDLVTVLRDSGFAVWRYKIEAVIFDERCK